MTALPRSGSYAPEAIVRAFGDFIAKLTNLDGSVPAEVVAVITQREVRMLRDAHAVAAHVTALMAAAAVEEARRKAWKAGR